MYYSGKNQEPRLKRSIRSGRDKQEQNGKTKLQSRRVQKKKDFISWIDRSVVHYPQSILHSAPTIRTKTNNAAQTSINLYFDVYRTCPAKNLTA